MRDERPEAQGHLASLAHLASTAIDHASSVFDAVRAHLTHKLVHRDENDPPPPPQSSNTIPELQYSGFAAHVTTDSISDSDHLRGQHADEGAFAAVDQPYVDPIRLVSDVMYLNEKASEAWRLL